MDRGDGAARPGDGDDSWLPGDRHDVVSTNVDSQGITAVLYSRDGGVLQVRHRNGCAYCYRGVSRRTYDGLLKSKSMEKYLRRIKRDYGEIEIDRPGIKEIRIQNFRSIKDKTVKLGDLTILIGANGTGKTSVLDALEIFLSRGRGVGDEDYYPLSERIDITVTINPGASAVSEEFLREGVVRLRKSFTKDGSEDGKKIRAEARRNRDFRTDDNLGGGAGYDARNALSASDLKKLASKIRQQYPDAPTYTKKEEYQEALAKYEHRLSQDPSYANRYALEFVEYAARQGESGLDGLLGTLILAPAMRNITADGQEGPGSLLSYLLDRTVRAEQGDRAIEAVSKKIDEAHDDYEMAVRGSLKKLGKKLRQRAKFYMDNARFRVELDRPKNTPSHPQARVRLRDNEHLSLVENAGSGFQRVYLLSLLDLIADMKRRGVGGDEAVDAAHATRLFVIDEPELYQHPQRQRRILKNLLKIVGDDPFVRVVCSTHSPYFVELRRVDTLRLFRRGERERPWSVTLEGLTGPMLGNKKPELPGVHEELSTWLDMNATHWITEGFFARMVVMVEGPGDRNMLLAAASAVGVDLAEHEISIVPADGVESVTKFLHLFAEFGIPVYPIWDLDHRRCGDRSDVQERNRQIAELACGIGQKAAPHGTIINSSFACFEDTLTASLAEDLHWCADLLEGCIEYRGLGSARERDRKAPQSEDGEDGEGEHREDLTGDPVEEAAIASQKRFLNSKLNVFKMLQAVREKSPRRLEGFVVVKAVRKIDTVGRSINAKYAWAQNYGRANSPNPNSAAYRAAEANRKRHLHGSRD